MCHVFLNKMRASIKEDKGSCFRASLLLDLGHLFTLGGCIIKYEKAHKKVHLLNDYYYADVEDLQCQTHIGLV